MDATPGIDRFCSRVAWVAPFQRAFGALREPCIFREGDAFAALARSRWREGRIGFEPLENMWGFACPLVGAGAANLLSQLLAADGVLCRAPLWLTGLPAEPPLLRERTGRLPRGYSVRLVSRTDRAVASLEGGLDGFLARRSPAFRRNLRAACRRVAAQGIRFESADLAPDQVEVQYARVRAIERRSWKALEGSGVDRGPMAEFYRGIWPWLAARGGLRLVVAIDARGRDVGYLHGGVLGRRFRGLQFSFDDSLRELGLGNLLQLTLIEALCAAGLESYDLGARSAYKERWAERVESTVGLLVLPESIA